jgi:hypothetical protein
MPYKFLCFTVLMFSKNLFASTITIHEPCGMANWVEESPANTVGQSVGKVTIDTLDRADFVYIGSDQGINSIRGTVTGEAALEVISDDEMRAYGWCYYYNGVEPAQFPNEIIVSRENDKIEWIFSFAHYKGGRWISTCNPTHEVLPDFICHGTGGR